MGPARMKCLGAPVVPEVMALFFASHHLRDPSEAECSEAAYTRKRTEFFHRVAESVRVREAPAKRPQVA
jgi:hypothetical protein